MNGSVKGFLWTALGWALLIGAYAGIELVRGNMPFVLLEWNKGGKFITIVVVSVLAIGTAVGYAGDQIRKQQGRK